MSKDCSCFAIESESTAAAAAATTTTALSVYALDGERSWKQHNNAATQTQNNSHKTASSSGDYFDRYV